MTDAPSVGEFPGNGPVDASAGAGDEQFYLIADGSFRRRAGREDEPCKIGLRLFQIREIEIHHVAGGVGVQRDVGQQAGSMPMWSKV